MATIMAIQKVRAWTVMIASAITLVVLILVRAEAFLVVTFALNLALLACTHRKELVCLPHVRWFSQNRNKGDD